MEVEVKRAFFAWDKNGARHQFFAFHTYPSQLMATEASETGRMDLNRISLKIETHDRHELNYIQPGVYETKFGFRFTSDDMYRP
jgi:hypothetical protein